VDGNRAIKAGDVEDRSHGIGDVARSQWSASSGDGLHLRELPKERERRRGKVGDSGQIQIDPRGAALNKFLESLPQRFEFRAGRRTE
jgi:hypothetical protein